MRTVSDRKIAMNIDIKEKLDLYPSKARERLNEIRNLIYKIAKEEQLGEITEDLKWGEPSYSVKKGSPIRMDWKSKQPNQVSLYFNCKTTLVETFKEIYRGSLQFEGNREIVLPISNSIPTNELKGCISKALRYHKIKHLPLLGS